MIKQSLCILQISSHFYPKVDGTVRSIDACIQGLREREHTVYLITRKMPGTPFFKEYKGVKVFRVGPSGGPLFNKLLLGLNQALTALKLFRRKRIDIIDAHGFSPLIAGLILKKVYHVPLVLSFHGFPTLWAKELHWRRGYENFLSYLFEKFLIRKADQIMVWSSTDAKRVTSLYGINLEEKIEVVPRVVDTSVFTYASARTAGKPIVLFVGTLSRIHGADLLIRAAPIILKEIPETKFILVGNGPLRPYLKKLTRDLNIEESVFFTGFIKDPIEIAKFYRKSSFVVVPARYKGGFPNVVVEALATGRPVITTLSLDRNLKKVGVFFVEKWNPNDLAKTIKQVLSNKESLKSLALETRTFVEKHYSKRKYISCLEKIYTKLIQEKVVKNVIGNYCG